MPPEKSMPQEQWDAMEDEEKAERLATGDAYALVEWFIYPPHALLGAYKSKHQGAEVDMGHWALDFRALHRVECDAVVNVKSMPMEAKRLELSVPFRTELRDKLSHYFYRPAKEDLVA
jgi:hypothetical protein